MTHSRGPVDVGRVLEAAAAASPLEAVAGAARELGLAFDAVAVSFLITDSSGRALVRLAHVPLPGATGHASPLSAGERRAEEESATVLPFDGGPEEQAVRTQTVQVVTPGVVGNAASRWWRILAPVTERGESIGLLELYLPAEPDHRAVAQVAQVAHVLSFVVIANRRHTDLFEWGQRSQAFSLSAEIQQRLLPEARTCETESFTVAGWLEPAAAIGGDTFDYSLARDLLHLSLTDAMGHGVSAALTASTCTGGLRGSRRRGMSLLDQASVTNDALFEHARGRAGDDFATGLIGRVELSTGVMEIVNAGHVTPYLFRDSEVISLDLRVDVPFGMFEDTSYGSTSVMLMPGDRMVFVTDGMLEHNVASIDLAGTIHDNADLHPRELVRALADSALEAAGHALQDDATVLCLDWHGTHNQSRGSTLGAGPLRATSQPQA